MRFDILQKIKSHPLITFTILCAIIYLGVLLKLNEIATLLFSLVSIIIFFYFTGEAMTKLGKCLEYLMITPLFFGAVICKLLIENNMISVQSSLEQYLIVLVSYFIIWILMIIFGELNTVKFATLIIAQVCTVLFLVLGIIIYFIPIDYFNNIFVDVPEFVYYTKLYSIDSRKIFELCFQLILIPPLITALLTYLIAEFRAYRKK